MSRSLEDKRLYLPSSTEPCKAALGSAYWAKKGLCRLAVFDLPDKVVWARSTLRDFCTASLRQTATQYSLCLGSPRWTEDNVRQKPRLCLAQKYTYAALPFTDQKVVQLVSGEEETNDRQGLIYCLCEYKYSDISGKMISRARRCKVRLGSTEHRVCRGSSLLRTMIVERPVS